MSNDPMNDDDLPATRGDLRSDTNGLEARLRAELASKDDLRNVTNGLEARLRAELASKDDLRKVDADLRDHVHEVVTASERRLSAELAQHANAIMEANRSDTRAMLEPYLSLPPRVEKLEAKPRRRSSR